MKQRITSALVGLVLLAVVIFFFDTIVLNIAIAIIAFVAVHELLNVYKLSKNIFYNLYAVVFTLYLSFQKYMPFPLMYLVVIGMIIFFILTLKLHEGYNFEVLATSFAICVIVPFFFTRVLDFRDSYGHYAGLYLVFLALGCGWIADSCAYFAGVFLGKHKLSPKISPKKTIEGAIGGMVGSIVLNLGIAFLFEYLNPSFKIEKLPLAIIILILSIVGIVGDLTASVVKRQHNVKDYGHIMPGHGGVMDRFDSVLLILPTLAFIVSVYGFVTYTA